MDSIKIEIKTNTTGLEEISQILYEMGLFSFEIKDAEEFITFTETKSYEWDYISQKVMEESKAQTGIVLYLEDSLTNDEISSENQQYIDELEMRIKDIKKWAAGAYGSLDITWEKIRQDSWKDNWKAYFKTTKVTDTIMVKPTWETYNTESPDEIVVSIDSSMAFGTGTHETTSMCIYFLEKYVTQKSRVLDIGCGSGILSIVAKRLGAEKVTGLDIDPISVETAQANAKTNELEGQIDLFQGDITKEMYEGFTLMVANLTIDIIAMIIEAIKKQLPKKGKAIFSGILKEKSDTALALFKDQGLAVLEVKNRGEWSAFVVEKKE